MSTLATTIKLALLIQYPDKYAQRRVRLVEFDDYWLLFAWYMLVELVRQAVILPVYLCVWCTRHAEAAKKVFFGWIVIPYAAG